ncbi:exocyst complex component EXO70A1-like [Panicum virgatum]|uniref:Exocyst subunit Exo70 family protein n=1 Tax=Panicum virgatum TaxID=38727 RepID=A0A8T0VLE3_PANVG|nr:exocyst complex component EXO70A1-like [Panicum virgatum]KAG2635247.1 hypothetical protein PVAP13_2NG339600 [Panicum virgatum]
MEASAAAELEAAERVVMRWGSTASAASPGGGAGYEQAMLFGGAGDRVEAVRFLQAVDDIRRLAPPTAAGYACSSVQMAIARLEDELRHVLAARALDLEIEALAGLSSLSLSGDRRNSDATQAASEEDDDDAGGSGSSSAGRRRTYRSLLSIREVDLYPADAISDLHAIVSCMAEAGYGRECVQVYASVRKPAVDSALRRLGVEKLSIGDVQQLEGDALEAKVRRWIRAARAAVPRVFASERRLCFNIFRDLPLCDSAAAATATAAAAAAAAATHDAPFAEAVKGGALQLFGFAEAISIGRRSPEKLFKIIDLHDALSDMLPDISDIFAASKAAESIYVQAAEIRSPLADAVRGILSDFENAVLRDPSKTPVPGGTIHPLTRYVMNYSSLISDYKTTLSELIISRPSSATSRVAAEGSEAAPAFPDLDLPDSDSQLPLAAHLVWIIAVLEHNLESKALLYKDAALYHLFLMNNVHYIVHKVKDSAELRGLIGDEYLKRLTGKFRLAATSYQRIAWLKILNCLRDEGLHATGGVGVLSGISKSVLRERFKAFNSAFEVAHKIESAWSVPDTQLREELRISISEKLLPAYRSFLGRFRHHIENGRHPEMYIKYSVEDLEIAMADFFEGAPSSPHNRRRSHG